MADKTKIHVTVGPGLLGSVFLVFLVLKLTHVIDWSWWWVTAPLWGLFALGFGLAAAVLGTCLFVGLVVLVILGIAALIDHWKR